MSEDSTLALSTFFGLIAPYVISYLKNTDWKTEMKMLVALAVCLAFGVVSVFITDPESLTSVENLSASVTTVFTVATVYYGMYFSGTSTNAALSSALYPKKPGPAPVKPLDKTPDN